MGFKLLQLKLIKSYLNKFYKLCFKNKEFFLLVVFSFSIGSIYFSHYLDLLQFGQDYNPVHLAKLFLNNDLPILDDSEIGSNANYLGLSSIFFWLGIIAEFTHENGAYVIWALYSFFDIPLFFISIYFFGYALSRKPIIGLITLGVLTFANEAVFRLNLGYDFTLFQFVYWNDYAISCSIFSLSAFFLGKIRTAGTLILLALLINPSIGIYFYLFTCAYIFLHDNRFNLLDARFFPYIALGVLGVLGAFIQVKLATPNFNPIDSELRNISIRTYGHAAIHIHSFLIYILVIFGMIFASIIYLRSVNYLQVSSQSNLNRKLFAKLLVIFILVIPLIWYWISYVIFPDLFILSMPSKSLYVVVLISSFMFSEIWYTIFKRLPLTCVILILVIGLFSAVIGTFLTKISFFGLFLLGFIILNTSNIFYRFNASFKKIDSFSTQYILIKFIKPFHKFTKNTRIYKKQSLHVLATLLLLAPITIKAIISTVDGRFEHAAEFRKFKELIVDTVPKNSILIPYTVNSENNTSIISFTSIVLRTDTRLGGLIYWSLGRNAYFNDKLRHENEQLFYSAAGINLWNDIVARDRLEKQFDPLRYFTGINFKGVESFFGKPTVINGPLDAYKDLYKKTNDMNLIEFSKYASSVGATHIILSKDKNTPWPTEPFLSTDQFGLIQIRAK